MWGLWFIQNVCVRSLSDEDKSKYLEQILGPFEDYGYSSDFDDEDLFSIASRADQTSEGSNSDSDDSGSKFEFFLILI